MINAGKALPAGLNGGFGMEEAAAARNSGTRFRNIQNSEMLLFQAVVTQQLVAQRLPRKFCVASVLFFCIAFCVKWIAPGSGGGQTQLTVCITATFGMVHIRVRRAGRRHLPAHRRY